MGAGRIDRQTLLKQMIILKVKTFELITIRDESPKTFEPMWDFATAEEKMCYLESLKGRQTDRWIVRMTDPLL